MSTQDNAFVPVSGNYVFPFACIRNVLPSQCGDSLEAYCRGDGILHYDEILCLLFLNLEGNVRKLSTHWGSREGGTMLRIFGKGK